MSPVPGSEGAAPRVVAVGGGHGLSRALTALRHLTVEPTAVVTVADDGGSSGRLRRDLGIIALGDLRMALSTLARNEALAAVCEHRFGRGELEGHALGNLLLLALAESSGHGFVHALDRACTLLDCAGRVLPSTLEPVRLKARVAGQQVEGQVRIAQTEGRVEALWVEPADPPACDEAIAAIAAADVIVLGPGSLFTSVIANVLVPSLAHAIAAASARVVYLLNLAPQPGETSGLAAQGHVEALLDAVPGLVLDVVVAHEGPPDHGRRETLGPVQAGERVREVVTADLAARSGPGGHDPLRLADVLERLLSGAGEAASRP